MKRWLFLLLVLLPLAACKKQSSNAANGLKTEKYTVRGKVVSTDAQQQEITLDHEAIPGFMEAMTMPYKVEDPAAIGELHPGDRISSELLVEKDSDGEFHHARLAHIVITAQARPDYKPTQQYNNPQKGQDVPDFKLTNQSGKPIHLGQYKGKALLITFIYTRCPLADFCPHMSRNFAEINSVLKKDSALAAKSHLLSISFDPAYDSPAVLKSYGGAYTGDYTNETFKQWEFAAPKQDELAEMEHFFQVGVTPGDSSSLNHSLSTLLIGPDGKIAAFYPGSEWKPADVLSDIRHAAA